MRYWHPFIGKEGNISQTGYGMAPVNLHRWSYPPCGHLAPYIDRFWGWKVPAGTPMPLVVPGTGSECFFHFNTPLQFSDGQSLPAAHLICPRRQTRQFYVEGAQELFAVRFKSGQLRHFTALPFTELQDQFHPVQYLWPDIESALLGPLSSVADPFSRVKLLETFLLGQLVLHQHREEQPLDALIQCLYYAPNRPVEYWAGILGWSRRHLERRFKQAYAVTPKHFARLSRLQHSLRQIALQPKQELLDVALERGYSDQSHFIHDCRSLTGMTPVQLRQHLLGGPNYYHPPSRKPT